MPRLLVLAALFFLPLAAAAQTPREACMGDYRKFCSGISPGGGKIKQCLIDHRRDLSEACRAALDAKLKQKL